MRNHHIILESYTCILTLEARGQAKRPPNFQKKILDHLNQNYPPFFISLRGKHYENLNTYFLGLKIIFFEGKKYRDHSLKFWMLLKWF